MMVFSSPWFKMILINSLFFITEKGRGKRLIIIIKIMHVLITYILINCICV